MDGHEPREAGINLRRSRACGKGLPQSSGFRVSGIWPLNSDISTENEFLPSEVTNRPARSASTANGFQEAPREMLSEVTNQPEPSTSTAFQEHHRQIQEQLTPTTPKTPEQLRPLPRALFFPNKQN